jgi:23S rRNA pseudouridine2605 synthase
MEKLDRLQKILAAAGLASRRQAEELIKAGRVSVNGRVVAQLGAKADASRDHIKVDGKLLGPPIRKVYVLLNKPRGVISTVADTRGRVKVTDLVKAKGRLFPVGRLDCNTEGVILLTNDGEFSRIVAAAGDAFPKVYQVKVRGIPDESVLKRLRCGLRLPDGTQLAPCRIRTLRRDRHAWLEVTLAQGVNREIRRMLEAVGHPVTKLRRTRIGMFTEAGLPVGCSRQLTPQEVRLAFRIGRAPEGQSRADL